MSEAETTSSEHPLARLWHHARGHRGKIIAASGFSVLNKLFDLAPPALIGAAVDIVVEREESLFAQLGFKDPTEQLIALAVVTVIVWVLESLFEYLLERT
ncbi:MAG: ABC transporter, partial [Myxococcota bacterium]|nr:ABC transporter [Myxococcota bacterium]